jgi:cellulose 1,4-beta-cellobiosidase
MITKKSFTVTLVSLALTTAAGLAGGTALTSRPAPAPGTAPPGHPALARDGARASTQLCGYGATPVNNGTYRVQNNEWGSSQLECITTSGEPGFQVQTSQITNTTYGPPGAYPSIYAGCHWGYCTAGGLGARALRIGSLTRGRVTTSFSASLPRDGDYDVSYDIWLNKRPAAAGQPNGTEVMVWLDHNGPVQPQGSIAARDVAIGRHAYDIWYTRSTAAAGGTVSFEMTSPVTTVSSLDLDQLIQEAVHRGYASPLWYLIDVEAGFEIWRGGSGLAVSSFGVRVGQPEHTATPPVITHTPPAGSGPGAPATTGLTARAEARGPSRELRPGLPDSAGRDHPRDGLRLPAGRHDVDAGHAADLAQLLDDVRRDLDPGGFRVLARPARQLRERGLVDLHAGDVLVHVP